MLIYLLLTPVVLSHLINPVLSILVEVDRQSIHKKNKSILRPILYLDRCIPNQNHFRYVRRRKKRNTRYKKPSPLYHLTISSRIYIGTKLLLWAIRERYDQATSDARRNLRNQFTKFFNGLQFLPRNTPEQISTLLPFWATRNFCILLKNFWQCFQWESKMTSILKTLFRNMMIYSVFRDQFKLDKVESILYNTLVLKILYI